MRNPYADKSLDELMAMLGGQGMPELADKFAPASVSKDFHPDEKLAMFMAGLHGTEQGRQFFHWLESLTVEAPYPLTKLTKDELSFAAAIHQSRSAVGETIRAALRQGALLIEEKNKQKDAKHEKSSG